MTKKKKKLILAAAALLFYRPLHAADLRLTVTTPGRGPQALGEIPASLEAVLPRQLSDSPGTTLDENLSALIPGLSTTRSAGDVNDRSAALTMRGLGSATQGGRSQGRTLVLLDGVPLNNSATGGVNWNELAAEEIGRVEVFKGPSSSLYGSNALGGTINVITNNSGAGSSLETSYGTYETFSAAAKAGIRSGALSLRAFGRHLESGGFVGALPQDRDQYTRRAFLNENSLGVKAAYDFNERGILRADYSRYEGAAGLGTNYQGTAKGEYRASDTGLARLSWKGGGEDLAWSLAAYDQSTAQVRAEAVNVLSHTDINVERGDEGIQSSVRGDIAGLRATLGFDWKHGFVDGFDDYNNGKWAKDKGEVDSCAPFIQLEKRLLSERLDIVAGLRYDTVRFHGGYSENTNSPALSSGKLPAHTWTSLSPKIAVGFRYGDKVSQYLSYARGFRAGELEDMVLTLVKGSSYPRRWYQKPNSDLGPEKAATVETGLRLNPAAGFYSEPGVYFTAARDFIYQVETGVIDLVWNKEKMYANIGEVEIYGLELPLKYVSGGFTAYAAYAQSHSKIVNAPGLNIKGNQLTYAPRHIYSAGLSLGLGAGRAFAGWTHKSRQFTNDANTETGSGYSVAHLGYSRQLGSGFSASLRAGNIFNERRQKAADELAPGRTFTFSAEAKF